jgi:type IV pilus assembly protein PilX
MLAKHFSSIEKQRGVMLFITLIVLVAMSLAGIALTRSVDTTNLIAGNLAFQQAATHSGDTGIEAAVSWLEDNGTGTTLHADIPGNGYMASRQDPSSSQSWDGFWTSVLNPGGAVTLPEDTAGNTVSYTIQRLCNAVGAPNSPGVNCSVPPSDNSAGNSKGAQAPQLNISSQVYYRITARVNGPRNTMSYVQAIVAM